MKIQITIATLVALLVSIHGAFRQCAGAGPDHRYESSGFLTANFTQNACHDSKGSISANSIGNQKCCEVSNANQGKFNEVCQDQRAGSKFPGFQPIAQPC